MRTNKEIKIEKLFDAVTVAASGSTASPIMEFQNGFTPDGFFSFQIIVTGSGTVKLQALVSNGDDVWILLSPDVAYGLVAAGGTEANGKYFWTYAVPLCARLKFRLVETGAVSSATVTVIMAQQ